MGLIYVGGSVKIADIMTDIRKLMLLVCKFYVFIYLKLIYYT